MQKTSSRSSIELQTNTEIAADVRHTMSFCNSLGGAGRGTSCWKKEGVTIVVVVVVVGGGGWG